MAGSIKIRAKESGGVVEVKALMSHPMETGTRKDSNGEPIPAHYIKEVTAEVNGKTVMTSNWGPAVSKNPYLSFKFKGASKGDTLTLSWTDNMGETASEQAEIK